MSPLCSAMLREAFQNRLLLRVPPYGPFLKIRVYSTGITTVHLVYDPFIQFVSQAQIYFQLHIGLWTPLLWVFLCQSGGKLDMIIVFACVQVIWKTTEHPLDRFYLSRSPTQPNQPRGHENHSKCVSSSPYSDQPGWVGLGWTAAEVKPV